MQNSNREQTHTSTCMKNKTRTRWSTLKLRTRLWRWNRFLRSTWSVTGFTSATEQVFLQQIKLKPILPLCPFWRFFFWYYSWCLTVQSEHFKTTLTTEFFLKQKSLSFVHDQGSLFNAPFLDCHHRSGPDVARTSCTVWANWPLGFLESHGQHFIFRCKKKRINAKNK